LARVDGVPVDPLGRIDGVPVYFRNSGFSFKVVVECQSGLSGVPCGTSTFDLVADDPTYRPDVQVETSRPLGDGSPAVCESGVPAVDPPDFGSTQAIANILNDLGCNFTTFTTSRVACTQDAFDNPSFVSSATQLQFCLSVERPLSFGDGDTTLSVRLRDTAGNLGPMQQLIVRIGPGAPPTFTSAPTATATVTASASRTPSTTPSRTRTRTPSAFPTTATPSQTSRASATPTPSPRSPTPTPTVTRTPTHGGATPTPTRTGAVTSTATRTPTRTPSLIPTASPTVVSARGPLISFFGVIKPDDTQVPPDSMTPDGVPIYNRGTGSGFSLVVEGQPGSSGEKVGHQDGPDVIASTFDPDVLVLPDLQIEVSRPLGNGSAAVCDDSGLTAGGVPAVDPPDFTATETNVHVVNDLACRFIDGTGQYRGRSETFACVQFPSGDFGFVVDTSTVQFCGYVSKVIEFPPGDTVVTARLQDVGGNPGPPAQLIIHVGP
jgi:hypothetical protein